MAWTCNSNMPRSTNNRPMAGTSTDCEDPRTTTISGIPGNASNDEQHHTVLTRPLGSTGDVCRQPQKECGTSRVALRPRMETSKEEWRTGGSPAGGTTRSCMRTKPNGMRRRTHWQRRKHTGPACRLRKSLSMVVEHGKPEIVLVPRKLLSTAATTTRTLRTRTMEHHFIYTIPHLEPGRHRIHTTS